MLRSRLPASLALTASRSWRTLARLSVAIAGFIAQPLRGVAVVPHASAPGLPVMRKHRRRLSITVAALAAASALQAQIVHYVFSPELSVHDPDVYSLTLNLATGETGVEGSLSGVLTLSRTYQQGNLNYSIGQLSGTMAYAYGYSYLLETGSLPSLVKPLAYGDPIDDAHFDTSGHQIGADQDNTLPALWGYGTTAYVGLNFYGSDNSWHYGWLELTREEEAIIISALAYNATPNAGIFAGEVSAIPEPSTCTALGGVCVLGFALVRRRSQARRCRRGVQQEVRSAALLAVLPRQAFQAVRGPLGGDKKGRVGIGLTEATEPLALKQKLQ